MSFVYEKYVKDLLEVLNDPQRWLGNEKTKLENLNKAIIDHNNLYKMLDPEKKKVCDSKSPKCPGLIDPITDINDADRLLFAVFGYGHPMNPSDKIENLRECVTQKVKCMQSAASGPASGPGPSYGGPTSTGSVPKPNPNLEEALAAAAKNKYLKYKNKYLSLKRNL